ncbi:hypothetical protein GCM10028820_23860 [Tessaracoccus terricola]
MSVQPGWYQDPEGPAGQARYWDGHSWGPRQEGPGSGTGPGPGQEPGSGRPVWLLPVVGVVVVAVLVGLGIWLVPPLLSPDDEPTPEPTVTIPEDPTPGEETPGQEQDPEELGELNCAAASSTNFDSGPEIRVAGIVVPFPTHEEWGFRFESSQWTWINDLHAWGTTKIEPAGEPWAAGLVVGRLEAGNGFGEPQQAAEAMVQCLVTYGPFNTGEEMDVTTSEAVTVDGMSGWAMEMTYPEEGEYGATVIRLLTLDAGQEGNLAAVIGFHPQDHTETQTVIDDALAGITHQ